jgi:hypothetical protein
MLVQPCLMFAGKLGDFFLDSGDHHVSVNNFVSVVPVSCNNGTKSNVLTALNNLNVGLAGTTPQLYSISPYWFNYHYVQWKFACKV